MGTDIKKGDRVRVTVEGEVQRVFDNGNLWLKSNDFGTAIDGSHVVTVEKIEPPVEVFGNGDLIRNRESPDIVILLTDDGGYTYVGKVNKGLHISGGDEHVAHRATANSKHWERVSIE